MLLYWLADVGDIAIFAAIDNTGVRPFADWMKCTTVLYCVGCGMRDVCVRSAVRTCRIQCLPSLSSLQGARKGKRSEPFRWE